MMEGGLTHLFGCGPGGAGQGSFPARRRPEGVFESVLPVPFLPWPSGAGVFIKSLSGEDRTAAIAFCRRLPY